LAGLEAALHAVTQEVDPALIEKHPALLVDESLQELQLCVGVTTLFLPDVMIYFDEPEQKRLIENSIIA